MFYVIWYQYMLSVCCWESVGSICPKRNSWLEKETQIAFPRMENKLIATHEEGRGEGSFTVLREEVFEHIKKMKVLHELSPKRNMAHHRFDVDTELFKQESEQHECVESMVCDYQKGCSRRVWSLYNSNANHSKQRCIMEDVYKTQSIKKNQNKMKFHVAENG